MSFYNNLPSKDDLVRAYLAARHEIWIHMFSQGVERYLPDQGLGALAFALAEWFEEPDFRSCAFINTVSEFWLDFKEAVRYKSELEDLVRDIAVRLDLWAPERVAAEVVILVEGAIVRRQMGFNAGLKDNLLALLSMIERSATK